MNYDDEKFKKAAKGLFGFVKNKVEDAVEDAIQDKLEELLPTSNTSSIKQTKSVSNTSNRLPKFAEKNRTNEENKTEKVIFDKDMYKSITPTSAFRKAIHFFNTNANSGIITYTIEEANRNMKVVTHFKDMQDDNYVKRENFYYSNGDIRKHYYSKNVYGNNYFEDYYSENMDTQRVDATVYHYIKSNRILFEDILYGCKFTDKKKTINDDGSCDIRLDLNNDNDNKDTISMYNRNSKSDSKYDIDFANRLDIYASDNYFTMHIDSNGFITNIKKLRTRCLYKDYLEGMITVKTQEIEIYEVTQLNKPITIREDDLNPPRPSIMLDHCFNKYMSYEETKQLKTRDTIIQLPDERALIEDKKFYQLYTDTGRIIIGNTELVYLPQKNVIEMKVGYFVNPLVEGKIIEMDLGCHLHIFYDCSRILKIINDMPDFQRVKKECKDKVRVEYCGNGKWTS